MKPNQDFFGRDGRFWANVKFVSEQVGYSRRTQKKARSALRQYSMEDIASLYVNHNFGREQIRNERHFFDDVLSYLNYRADILNKEVEPLFMNCEQAAAEYNKLKKQLSPMLPPSFNKQKGEKRHPAYLSCMVAMVAESIVGPDGFINDTRNLAILTAGNVLMHAFSRRFDGALPSTKDPIAVWEIKEYYGTTTFGSRVADGVYETLLDGYEFEGVRQSLRRDVKHYLFIDDRFTWWDCGKSYLCRMMDMLHTQHVDEIFFGREVLTDWGRTLTALVGR